MGKLVVLDIKKGNSEGDFEVILVMGEDGDSRFPIRISGKLPPAPEVSTHYNSWQSAYRSLDLRRRLEVIHRKDPRETIENCRQSARVFGESMRVWYDSPEFFSIREKLSQNLDKSDEIRLIVQTKDSELRRLPWHLFFEQFLTDYPKAEVALSPPEYDRPHKSAPAARERVRILAVLGNSSGIDIQADRQLLEKLSDAETVFLAEPTRQELDEQLWDDRGWDILFFGGHSSSQKAGETGYIYINQTENLTIKDLKYALIKAIERGLKLAIFNSCDGLGLAQELAELHAPQIIVMREPVPDRVAQKFLKDFLQAFSGGKSLYLAVREAREKLHGLEGEFPCASWLPAICQHPAEIPPTWQQLCRIDRPLQLDASAKPLKIASRIPFVLPQMDVLTFTGRQEELRQLEELLIKRQGSKVCSIVGLAGAGGIGKSAIACHFATRYKEFFPDGVIGLRVDGKDADTIAREFARRCGEEIDPEDKRDAATIVQEVFAHRRMLLIFDNADSDNIRELRPGGDSCAVIVTTRDRHLAIALDIPDKAQIHLPLFPEPDALELLKKLIGENRAIAEIESARKIIQLTGNLPLALQIVGAALKLQTQRSLADYAASLREEQVRLKRLQVRGDEHLNLRACFSLSLKQLQPEEIDFFACLSVCAEEGFSRQTARVTGDCDEYAARDYLDYLCRISLLNYSKVGDNRFVFHTLIRLFAGELADERLLRDKAAARHAEFFIKFLKSSQVNNPSVASVIAEELDEIILAAKWLQKQETADYEFASHLQPFFEQYGYWKQAVELMSEFQSLAERLQNWEFVVKFIIQQAKYLSLQGKLAKAEKVLAPIPDILSRIEVETTRQLSEAKWLTTLGGILQRKKKRLDEALKALQRALTIQEQLDDREGLAKVLTSLGGVLRRQERFEEALSVFQRVIEINEALNDPRSVAIGLNCLGGVLQKLGRFDQAVSAFRRQIKINEAFNDRRSVAIGLNGLGGVLQQLGRFDEAVNAFQGVIEIGQALNDPRSLAIARNGLKEIRLLQLEAPKSPSSLKQGSVKFIIRHETGYRYGFIAPNDGTPDIYFRENFIEPDCFSKLSKGSFVEVEIAQKAQGLCAKTIRIIA